MPPIKYTLLKLRNTIPATSTIPAIVEGPIKPFPLHVPELVELILSFLSDYHLRVAAGRVCRQWRTIAKELLEREADWTLARADVNKENDDGDWTYPPDTPERWRKLTRRKTWRVRTHDDEVKSPTENPYYDFRPESWEALTGTLKEIIGNRNAQHKRLGLHLACLLNLQRDLLPLLSIVGSRLERLVVDQVLHRPIALESVLALCPRLLHLSLAYPWPYLITDIDSAPFDSEEQPLSPSSPQQSTRILRSLVLRGVIVLKAALLRVICSCPDLCELRLSCFETKPVLSERSAAPPNNPLAFFEAIAESCPRLQSLQFSKAFEMEPMNRRYGFEYHHRIATLFPMAKEWTFEANDLFKLQPYYSKSILGSEYANMTTLVIESPLLDSEFPEKRLNNFLVSTDSSAHNLLHLRVTGLAFSIWWWDLELRQGHTRTIAKEEAIQNEFFCADIWRCRRLKTLHVRLRDKDELSLGETSMRIMCGYVSKVLPELEDLVLEKRFVGFEEDAGLVLLTRLNRLKRLSVVGLFFGDIGNAWVDWLAKDWARTSRTKKQIQNEWRMARSGQKEETVARVPFRTVEDPQPGDSTREYVIDGIDMRYVGQLRDIVEVVKERLADDGVCWPQMEYLRFQSGNGERHWNNSLARVQSKVRKLRPEIDNSRSPDKIPLTKDSPLEVPQILEMIVSNLTSHQVRGSMLPICHQWHLIAQPHAFRSIVWSLDEGAYDDGNGALYEHIFGITRTGQVTSPVVDPLKYLGVTQRLVIRADRREHVYGIPFQWESGFSPASWQVLLEAITITPHLLNLSELRVLCPIDFALEAFELLKCIGSLLTKLRLEVTRHDGTLLASLLSLCPKLEQLTVEFSCSEEVFTQELYSRSGRPSVSQAIPLAHPSLRSLTLRRIAVDEESLLSLVDICFGLEDLVLDQIRGATDNEIEMQDGRARLATVFRSIARVRPGLKRFGFLPCVLRATTELVQATIVPLFSEATEWVFPATSILDVAEICAPGVMVPLDCLDMEGVLDSLGAYRKADPLARYLMPDDVLGTSRIMIWGCRDLQTLHIQVQCPKGDVRSAASSRLVFGYISIVCPALEELRLQKEHLDLSMDGGLCLLARLNRLRSLGLTARDGVWESTPGLDWMAHELSSRQSDKLTRFIDQSISEEVFNSIYRHYPLDYQAPVVPGIPYLPHNNVAFVHGRDVNAGDGGTGGGNEKDASVTAGESTVPNYVIDGIDMRYLSQLQGIVEMCKQRISSGNTTWWPRMEYLEITRKERFSNAYVGTAERTHAQVYQMRPDIEFHTLWR
ncbi:hypothetical protein BG015_011834 [Linnemannia schmuckeri]|uniref:F-box domain-containing protein n=1 Tax=Linnemannia schmuckeri TaxID=64567 RepID=A0A9P5V827_9FUNG|nr:hypothetical protein BG015_011834 [Linnemannia schmuckeri]